MFVACNLFTNMPLNLFCYLLHLFLQYRISYSDKKSNVIYFTSHFYTKLEMHGVLTVSNWTESKKIEVFDKKAIFIPINKSEHWSLLIVVNPGEINNSFKFNTNVGKEKEKLMNLEAPFLLHLDSLKIHNSSKIGDTVRQWLDYEAKTKSIYREENSFFTNKDPCYMPSLCPKGKDIICLPTMSSNLH